MNASSPTILVVDDNLVLLRSMHRTLEKNGYNVLESESAEHAIEIWDEHFSSIDLLLTDVVMPGMTGLELVDILRKKNPRLKVLVISGFLPELLRPSVEGLALATFLEKPFSSARLVDAVRDRLAQA